MTIWQLAWRARKKAAEAAAVFMLASMLRFGGIQCRHRISSSWLGLLLCA